MNLEMNGSSNGSQIKHPP